MIANRYRVDALLGQGGMGAAYAATNLVTGKRVALKWILHEQSASRLHRLVHESRAASRVRHPNIVDVYDVGEHQGALFLVMELLAGQSLQAAIDAGAPLPLDQVLAWLLPALRGVRAAHRSGVIHRDLKPANIFLCAADTSEPPIAKVLDFGVSKIVPAAGMGSEPSLTDSGAVIGTPSYMAPEQLEDPHAVDARVDVYACGLILYQALSGRRAFEADSYATLVTRILTADPTPLVELRPDLPGALCAVIHTAMQRRRELRFADMDGLIQALAPFAGQMASDSSRSTREPDRAGTRWTRRGTWFAVGLSGLIAFSLAARVLPSQRVPRAGAARAQAVHAEPRSSVQPGTKSSIAERSRADEAARVVTASAAQTQARETEPTSAAPRSILIATDPPGATVSAPANADCVAPCTLRLPQEPVVVRARLHGFRPAQQSFAPPFSSRIVLTLVAVSGHAAKSPAEAEDLPPLLPR